jgi:ribosome-binding factor A
MSGSKSSLSFLVSLHSQLRFSQCLPAISNVLTASVPSCAANSACWCMRDHGLPSVSVSDVEITRDLDWATVWVTALMPEQGLPTVKALNEISHEIRHSLAHCGMRMRRVPELKFKYDDSVDKGERIESLLREQARDMAPPEDDAQD